MFVALAAGTAFPARAGSASPASTAGSHALPVLISDGDTLIDVGPTWRVSLKVCCAAFDIAITPDAQFAYVTTATTDNGDKGTVTVISGVDTPDPAVLTTLRLPGLTEEIAMAPDGKYAYVVSSGSNTLSVIAGVETGNPRVVDTLDMIDTVVGVAVSPNGKYVYVTSWDTVIVIGDADTPHPRGITSISTAAGPYGIAITPNGKYAYAANYVGGKVTLLGGIESGHPTVIRSFAFDEGPTSIAITPDGQNAFITSTGNDLLVIGDAETSPHVLKTMKMAYPQFGITTSADGQYAYAAMGDAECDCSSVGIIGMADSAHPAVVDNWTVPPFANWATAVPPVVGVYSSFTKMARDSVGKALHQGWPLIANHSAHSGGSATHCPAPYTGRGSDQEVLPALSQFDKTNSVDVPWLSIWTVASPGKFSSTPEKVGLAAGTRAARELAEVMKAYPGTPARPTYVVLDPEGATCGNFVPPDLRGDTEHAIAYVWNHLPVSDWNELVEGWNKGIESVQGLTPAVYLSKTEYGRLATGATAPYQNVFVAVGFPGTPGKATGTNVLGYVAFYATCTKGIATQVAKVKSWGGRYNTVQFRDSGSDCPPATG